MTVEALCLDQRLEGFREKTLRSRHSGLDPESRDCKCYFSLDTGSSPA